MDMENDEKKINTTADNYRNWLYYYGIFPLLSVMEIFEEYEQYNECQKILCAIKKHNDIINDHLPTRMYKGYAEELRISVYNNMGVDMDFENNGFYTMKLILEIMQMHSEKNQQQ